MDSLQDLAEFFATLCCALFAGAAVYISLVEHPARLACGTEVAITQFAPSYHRASLMQASLAILGLVFALIAWLDGAGAPWLVGGVLLGAVVPFTLLVVMPTNRRLQAPDLDRNSPQARRLLQYWGQLHTVRSGLSVLALLIFLLEL